jgi:hypothetical protein
MIVRDNGRWVYGAAATDTSFCLRYLIMREEGWLSQFTITITINRSGVSDFGISEALELFSLMTRQNSLYVCTSLALVGQNSLSKKLYG